MIVKKLFTLFLLTSKLFATDKDDTLPLMLQTERPGKFEVSLKIEAADLKNAMASRFPTLFAGRIESVRTRLQDARASVGKVQVSTPQICIPEAAPILHWLASEITKMAIKYPEVQYLVNEINSDLKLGTVDIGKIYGYGFRALGAISDQPTQEALSLFKQFRGDEVERDLRNNWKSPFSILALDNDNVESPYIASSVSSTLQDLLSEEVDRKARPSLHYPIFGKGKLGVAMLIESFINRLYPLPIQGEHLTAHAISMTPLLFGYHDYLHGKADQVTKESNFDNAMYAKMSQLTQDKLDAERLVAPLSDFMVAKSNLIEDSLLELLDLYFTHYLPENKMIDLKKAMVGFFELMHEDFNVTPKIYDDSNFDEILEILLGKTSILNSSVEEPFDLLKTDPVSGISTLSSEEILDTIFASGLASKEQRYYFSPEYLLKRSDIEGKKYRVVINDNTLFTTVTLKLPGAVAYNWTVPTLKYQFLSSIDSVGLLKLAGIKMQIPSISDLQSENGREIALNFLTEVRQNQAICRDAFKSSAQNLIGLVPNGETKSLWKKFWDKSEKLNKKLKLAAAEIQ